MAVSEKELPYDVAQERLVGLTGCKKKTGVRAWTPVNHVYEKETPKGSNTTELSFSLVLAPLVLRDFGERKGVPPHLGTPSSPPLKYPSPPY